VLARYEHPHLGRWPAVTTHAHGAGRVTYVGMLPDRATAVALARHLRPAPDEWAARPESVTVVGARNPQGERVRFVSNWSWDPATITLPDWGTYLLSGDELSSGDELNLEPWDVRVFLERPRGKVNEEERLQ
jgi:beta-galactosidase